MGNYFVLSERGKYFEVRANSLDDVVAYNRLKWGKDKVVTDVYNSPLLKGRRNSGLAEAHGLAQKCAPLIGGHVA